MHYGKPTLEGLVTANGYALDYLICIIRNIEYSAAARKPFINKLRQAVYYMGAKKHIYIGIAFLYTLTDNLLLLYSRKLQLWYFSCPF